MTKHSEFDVNLKASPIEQRMQNAREYAKRIHKLSKKLLGNGESTSQKHRKLQWNDRC